MVSEPTSELEAAVSPSEETTASGVVRAAGIVALGNISSRVLGLGREIVIANLFGATAYVSIFRVASTLIFTLYDFLVGGMVSAALVPVFSEHVGRRADFWRLVSAVLSALAVLLVVAVLALEVLAELVFTILGEGYDPELHATGVQMIRLILPAVCFLGIAGVLSGILLSLKRFTWPAFTTAALNLGIIVGALALAPSLGITSLIVGVLIGSLLQVILQWFGLRDSPLRLTLDFSHPALRQILRLYLPVLAGVSVMMVGVAIDRNLASRTGDQSLAWMQSATALVQFPLGLVAAAISFAILPDLARARGIDEFRQTLVFGLKLVLLLILPASVGLFWLAVPVVDLIFEHGAFTAEDTQRTAHALQLYLLGTPFAAIDQPLVFAFYARKNTLLPNVVAAIALGIYLAVALPLHRGLGYLGLVLANAAQLTGHALVMLWLTQTRLGSLNGLGLAHTTLRMLIATAAMSAALAWLPTTTVQAGLVGELLRVAIPAVVAGLIYVLTLKLLRVRELDRLTDIARRRWSR